MIRLALNWPKGELQGVPISDGVIWIATRCVEMAHFAGVQGFEVKYSQSDWYCGHLDVPDETSAVALRLRFPDFIGEQEAV